jgi:hypothetical protein
MLTVDELRPLSLFEGLSDPELEWFCEHGTRVELAEGERMLERGQATGMPHFSPMTRYPRYAVAVAVEPKAWS